MKKPTFDLELALREARPGARIAIPAGRWKLARPLVLARNVTLIGRGAKRTVLVGAAPGSLITCRANVTLADLAVQRIGGHGDVILAANGRFSMTGVHVSGGKGDTREGAGLRVRGSARVIIEESVASRNEWDGFALEGDSVGTIRRCAATGNGNAGVQISERARGEVETLDCEGNLAGFFVAQKGTADARGVVCRNNRLNGIIVCDDGRAKLAKSASRKNEQNGILVVGRATCTVTASTFEDNAWQGVFIDTRGACSIERSDVARNGTGGIWAEAGAPALRSNRVVANRSNGIFVSEATKATIERNTCTGNRGAGIVVDDATAQVTANTCTKNKEQGILLIDASAVLEGNVCKDNGDAGISALAKARTRRIVIRRNRSTGNDGDGIAIAEKANVDVLENTCDENDGSGIGFFDEGSGVARANRCAKNEEEGLESSSSAPVLLAENRATKNEGHGICIYGRGAAHVTLDGNHSSSNGCGAFDRPSLLRHFPVAPRSCFAQACEYWRLTGQEICGFSLHPEKALSGYPAAMARHFRPIGRCGEGSTIAFFLEKPDDLRGIENGKAPIAFLGSEGVGHVLIARTFDEFLSLLAHGCVDLAEAIRAGKWKKPTKDSSFVELAAHLRERLGVKPAPAPRKVIARAVEAHGDLEAWVRQKLHGETGVTKEHLAFVLDRTKSEGGATIELAPFTGKGVPAAWASVLQDPKPRAAVAKLWAPMRRQLKRVLATLRSRLQGIGLLRTKEHPASLVYFFTLDDGTPWFYRGGQPSAKPHPNAKALPPAYLAFTAVHDGWTNPYEAMGPLPTSRIFPLGTKGHGRDFLITMQGNGTSLLGFDVSKTPTCYFLPQGDDPPERVRDVWRRIDAWIEIQLEDYRPYWGD